MYALDVNVERAEDVLTHKKLLQEAHDPGKRHVFDVRLVQVSPSSNGHNDDSINSSSPRTEVVQSIHPPPAFVSSPNLEALAIEANKSHVQDGDSATNACAKYLRPMHEITFSADDKPKLMSQVLKMEAKILNFLGFQLSVPTTKKFLRRFIQAAHINYKVPRVELEFLCNYLAELTLTGYTFLRFLPSHIVASVVFFARWILDQSQQPWIADSLAPPHADPNGYWKECRTNLALCNATQIKFLDGFRNQMIDDIKTFSQFNQNIAKLGSRNYGLRIMVLNLITRVLLSLSETGILIELVSKLLTVRTPVTKRATTILYSATKYILLHLFFRDDNAHVCFSYNDLWE